MESITSENFVKKVLENVKHYDYEPVYWVGIYKNAPMELYINDMPVFKDYDDTRYGVNNPINYMILKRVSRMKTK